MFNYPPWLYSTLFTLSRVFLKPGHSVSRGLSPPLGPGGGGRRWRGRRGAQRQPRESPDPVKFPFRV